MSDKYLQQGSGFYLTEHLPDNWQELDENKLLDYIEQHLWQPFENWPPIDVLDEISTLADSFQQLEDELLK